MIKSVLRNIHRDELELDLLYLLLRGERDLLRIGDLRRIGLSNIIEIMNLFEANLDTSDILK